jgi:hypothetical protein
MLWPNTALEPTPTAPTVSMSAVTWHPLERREISSRRRGSALDR